MNTVKGKDREKQFSKVKLTIGDWLRLNTERKFTVPKHHEDSFTEDGC